MFSLLVFCVVIFLQNFQKTFLLLHMLLVFKEPLVRAVLFQKHF